MVKKHAVKTSVLARIKKSSDLETHVRLVRVEGAEVLEFRDYIPSLDEYGRGYWFNANDMTNLKLVSDAIQEAMVRDSRSG